jgi:chromosome partitioning protein
MYDAESKGAQSYLELAREVLQKNNLTRIDATKKLVNQEDYDK